MTIDSIPLGYYIAALVFVAIVVALINALGSDPTMITPPPASSDVHPLRPSSSFDAHADEAMAVVAEPLYVPAEWVEDGAR